jgi:hypothetical protein
MKITHKKDSITYHDVIKASDSEIGEILSYKREI